MYVHLGRKLLQVAGLAKPTGHGGRSSSRCSDSKLEKGIIGRIQVVDEQLPTFAFDGRCDEFLFTGLDSVSPELNGPSITAIMLRWE